MTSPRPVRRRANDAAVAEIVGTVLLIAITVVTAAGVGLLVLNAPGPIDTTRPALAIQVNPGPDGTWGSGNENVSVYHRGGDSLPSPSITIIVRVAAPTTTFTFRGSGLQSAFSDGQFRIGETWYSTAQPMTVASGVNVDVAIVAIREGGSVLIGDASRTAGG